MEEDLFTFTAYYLGQPVWAHQGFPSYHSASTFQCLCGKSKVDLPHNSITTRTGILWRCSLPSDICGRRYTFHLDYPDHVPSAQESVNVKLNNLERSMQLVHRSLQQQQTQDPIAAIQRAYRQHQQPVDAMQLREDISDAFQRLGELFVERMWGVEESLDGLNDRAEDAVDRAEQVLQHVEAVDRAIMGNGDVLHGLQELQEQVGAIGNLGHMIQQINSHDGFAQLHPRLFAISQTLQRLDAAVGPMADTCDAVRDIQEQLNKYNKRYDKSIGVIIG